MIVEEAIVRRGFKKVAILADSTNYGQLGREDLEKALAAKGVKPVAVEKFNIKDIDMTAQLLKAKEAGADVVLTYGIGPELAQIANGMAKLGWKVPMIGSWTLSMANYIDNAGANGEGARMPQTFIQEPKTPKRKAFIEAYLKKFKPKNDRIDSPVSAAQGYDSVYLLAAAIKQAGSTDGPKIKAALENLKRQGRRRRDGLRQAVHARPITTRSPPTSRCSARSRAGASSTPTPTTRRRQPKFA